MIFFCEDSTILAHGKEPHSNADKNRRHNPTGCAFYHIILEITLQVPFYL